MSKKNKFDNIFTNSTEKESSVESINENNEPVNENKEEIDTDIIHKNVVDESLSKKTQDSIYVAAKFNTDITEIGYEFLATGEKNVVSASNGKLYMLQGRQYYVPINIDNLDSDSYNIKVHIDAADRFDVRYITDGLAAVVPIRHNAILKSGERLCILTKLML